VFERVAEQNPDVVFAKVNTDDEQEIAGHFQIRSIPTLMVFREQIIVFSQPGALPQNALEQIVEKSKQLDMEDVRKQIGEKASGDEGVPESRPRRSSLLRLVLQLRHALRSLAPESSTTIAEPSCFQVATASRRISMSVSNWSGCASSSPSMWS